MKNQEQITDMFNRIAPRYDFLNHSLSLGIDKKWRKRVVNLLRDIKNPVLLDVATGTGDLAIELTKLNPISIYAVDISEKMLEIAVRKIAKKRLQMIIFPKKASSEDLPFDDDTFNAVTVAFGARNFGNPEQGLKEMSRVTKPGGKVIVLEFSMPSKSPVKQLYHFYFTKFLPWWGGVISGNKKAYEYLPASVIEFPEGAEFEKILVQSGLKPIQNIQLTFGIATIYVAEKPLQ